MARVTLEVADGVAHLRLTRPDAGNAIDRAMVEAIDDAVRAVEKAVGEGPGSPRPVRALLITAAGRSFCVGGDLRYLHAHLDDLPAEIAALIDVWHGSTLPRLAALPVPVVTAARGTAGGGGLGLLWCADLRLAAENLKLVSGFVQLGLTGDGGSTWHLPRLAGLGRTQQFALRGMPLGAAEALAWGVVSRVVPVADLADVAWREAVGLASGPTWVYGRIKRLIADVTGYTAHLAAERDAMCAAAGRADVPAAIEAFLAGRRPVFDGHRPG
jgi:2-(1,2-epoxy-1,2-dihydrophenyl)acetyl-CoA isomerase